jgi:hypothetical protein
MLKRLHQRKRADPPRYGRFREQVIRHRKRGSGIETDIEINIQAEQKAWLALRNNQPPALR